MKSVSELADETYLKVAGRWPYVRGAIERDGACLTPGRAEHRNRKDDAERPPAPSPAQNEPKRQRIDRALDQRDADESLVLLAAKELQHRNAQREQRRAGERDQGERPPVAIIELRHRLTPSRRGAASIMPGPAPHPAQRSGTTPLARSRLTKN